MSSKKKERSCPFSSSKPRPKKGKKVLSCESAADLASSDKGFFFNQDEWLQEIEEQHESKPDTSEKQSVEMSASRSKIRLEEAEEEQEDVGSWAKLNGPTIFFPPPRKFVCFLLPVKPLLFKKTLYLLDA